MNEDRKKPLAEFVAWAAAHITGDEKGEAQIFLDRLFQAFGQKGVREAGATLEMRVKKADRGGTSFADLVWKPIVLIEMKKRGEDLSKHYRQAFDYWVRLAPGRPRYAVLCNFDEFWVYDFETQMDSPLDQVPLSELPERWGPLAFLFPHNVKPAFGNDQEAVTRKAADLLAECFNKLVSRGTERETAQRFTLQMLVALFAEDIGLLDKYFVTQLLEECQSPADSFDLLGGLFVAMNTPGGVTGGRYKGVDYFNGGLFADPARLELYPDELSQLRHAAKSNWSKVRPEIFGTLFEHSLGKEQRHAFGAHFTSPVDIMKIVGPTIVEPWRDQIENATSAKRLNELLNRLHQFRVLDPACGSGNFLYIAYREMKRLEARMLERITEISKRTEEQGIFGFVTAEQFFGLDITPFAIELAKVTMMIGRKLAIDEFHTIEPALPLDNLDRNFLTCDALIDGNGNPTVWPEADVIIGNPPFLGAKRLKPERGADYVNAVRNAYPKVPGMADYCVYWFRKAEDALPECSAANPVAGRAGLVGTQNIRNNQSRVGGLDYIVQGGTILEAVDNQPWSGEANVHVSIVNWVKTLDETLLPKQRRLWFRVEVPFRWGREKKLTGKEYELDCRDVDHINSALSDKADVSGARELLCNIRPQRAFTGQMVGHERLLLSVAERYEILARDPKSRAVIHPHLNGRELLTGSGQPQRFVIDFGQMDQIEAAAFTGAFQWVARHVLPDREAKATQGLDKGGKVRSHHKGFLAKWWQLSFGRPELMSLLAALPRYLCCSRVTKRPVFVFVDSGIRPGDALSCFTFADDYSFGVLQSSVHWLWFTTKCSKLTERFRYSPESVFNTFPWPQAATEKDILDVALAGQRVRDIRATALTKTAGGLKAVYQTLELPGQNPLKDAHAALDAAVLAAYGFSARRDLLEQLLILNGDVAARIASNEPAVGPGVPATYTAPASLVTDDCIKPPK
jgi:SAM-dependent methyltransferase